MLNTLSNELVNFKIADGDRACSKGVWDVLG